MKILRPRLVRALRAFFCLTGTALVAASAALLLLQPDSAWGAARSRVRHSSYRPLSPSSFVRTSHNSVRSRKTSARGRSSALGSHRNAGVAHQTYAVRGHLRSGQQLQYRQTASGRAYRYPSARERASYARHTIPMYGRRSRRDQPDTVVAEVSRRSRDGSYIARLRVKPSATRNRYISRNNTESRSVVVASAPLPARPYEYPRNARPTPRLNTPGPRTFPSPSRAQEGIYAEGVSHPDGDDTVPRRQPAGNQAVIGTAEAIAAPGSAPVSRVPQPQAVSGFGSEVALASPGPTDRPGGTRRRDHPIAASALPEDAPPVPLEEREAITDAAVRPAILPEIYDSSGRLVMPAPLKGSREVLVHQNTMATSEGLERIQDDAELDRLRAEHQLVGFPVSESLRVNEDLPYNRRYARPWTVVFATDIARDFYARFRQPLQVNSAVRTVNFQMHLQRVNGNAAGTEGDSASPHLTGQAIDLGKRGMSAAEIAWMRDYLLPLIQAGKIDVEEEFQQACFHISVYRSYIRRPAHEYAQLNSSSQRTSNPGSGVDEQ